MLKRFTASFHIRDAQACQLVREGCLEKLKQSAVRMGTELVERVVEMAELAVLEQTCQNGCETFICQVVAMEDEPLDQGFFTFLGLKERLHGLGITLIQMIANELEHVRANLAEERERHDLIVVTVTHIIDVWVFSSIVSDRVFRKPVKDFLVDVRRGTSILFSPVLVIVVQSLDQLSKGVLEVNRLDELLESQFASLGQSFTPWLIDRSLLFHQRRVEKVLFALSRQICLAHFHVKGRGAEIGPERWALVTGKRGRPGRCYVSGASIVSVFVDSSEDLCLGLIFDMFKFWMACDETVDCHI